MAFQKLPRSFLQAPRRIPDAFQKLPTGSQTHSRSFPEVPRSIPKASQRPRAVQNCKFDVQKAPGQDLAQKGRFGSFPQEKFNSRPRAVQNGKFQLQKLALIFGGCHAAAGRTGGHTPQAERKIAARCLPMPQNAFAPSANGALNRILQRFNCSLFFESCRAAAGRTGGHTPHV